MTMVYSSYVTRSLRGRLSAETSIGLVEGTVYRNDSEQDVFVSTGATYLSIDNDMTIAQLRTISKIGTKLTLRFSVEHCDDSMGTTRIPGANVFYDVVSVGGMWDWQLSPSLTLTTSSRRVSAPRTRCRTRC